MMKVFLVTRQDWEYTEIVGIALTREVAESLRDKEMTCDNKRMSGYRIALDYEIEEKEVIDVVSAYPEGM